MAEAQLRQFLEKVRQLNAFVALSEADPRLRQELRDCEHHDQVVALARRCGFEIGRRWGEANPPVAVAYAIDAAGRAELPGSAAAPAEPLLVCPEADEAGAAGPEPIGTGSDASAPDGRAQASGAMHAAEATTSLDGPITALLERPCPPPGEEVSVVVLETPQWRLEHIHSCAAISPAGFWYEQAEEEWVTLLQGSARLRFADEESDRQLGPGDSLLIRKGRRHRVTATDPAPGTVWLALFWRKS